MSLSESMEVDDALIHHPLRVSIVSFLFRPVVFEGNLSRLLPVGFRARM